jgi:hypothetical protein
MAKKKPKPAIRKKPPAQAMSLTAMHPAGMIFTLTITRKPGAVRRIPQGFGQRASAPLRPWW